MSRRHRIPVRPLAAAVASLLLASCAAGPPPAPLTVTLSAVEPAASPGATTFVLLPASDGSVGAVVVTNEAGRVDLSAAREAVTVTGTTVAPGPARVMTQAEVDAVFGPAIGSLPAPPSIYLLYFATGSTDLQGDSLPVLDLAVREIRGRTGADVSIVGHTDTRGDRNRNLELSLRRATVVAELLASRGIDVSAFEVVSHGQDSPLVPTGDQVDEPRNRRVEITVR